MSKKSSKPSEQEILFPEKVLTFGDVVVTMRPVPMDKLPLFMNAVVRLFMSVANQVPMGDLLASCMTEFLMILPYCMDTDMSKLPAYLTMDLFEVFIEQNLSEDKIDRFLLRMPSFQKTASTLSTKISMMMPKTADPAPSETP